MSVTDTGWYIAPFPSVPYELRDQIVWPPGWELPAVTETVTLDASLTVPGGGITIAGYTKAAGERWVARTSANWSHRVGYIPGSAAGSYVAGNTVPMYRFPRFVAAKRSYRGLNSPTFANPNTRPSFIGLYEATNFRQRTAGFVQINMPTTTGLLAGMMVAVTGFSDATFNGVFEIAGIGGGGSLVFYRAPGPNVGITFDPGGRIAIRQPEMIRRMHQLGGLRSWVRTTGPAPGDARKIDHESTTDYNVYSRKDEVQLRPRELPRDLGEQRFVQGHDLGNVGHGILRQSGEPRGKQDISRSVRPADIAGERNADNIEIAVFIL